MKFDNVTNSRSIINHNNNKRRENISWTRNKKYTWKYLLNTKQNVLITQTRGSQNNKYYMTKPFKNVRGQVEKIPTIIIIQSIQSSYSYTLSRNGKLMVIIQTPGVRLVVTNDYTGFSKPGLILQRTWKPYRWRALSVWSPRREMQDWLEKFSRLVWILCKRISSDRCNMALCRDIPARIPNKWSWMIMIYFQAVYRGNYLNPESS